MSRDLNAEARLTRLNAALDGESSPLELASLEAERARDPALAAAGERLAAVQQVVRAAAARERAPDRLVAAVARLAPEEAPARRWAAFPTALAASLAVVAFLGGLGAGVFVRLPAAPSPDDALAASYLRAAISGGGIDVASSDRHTVKPWLATRAPLGAAAVDLSDQGFKLIGGRVDVVGFAPVPTLVYGKREHVIALTELPPDHVSSSAPRIGAVQGLNVVAWSDGQRAYRAISDIDRPDLEAFVAAFREAAAKQGE